MSKQSQVKQVVRNSVGIAIREEQVKARKALEEVVKKIEALEFP